MEENRTIWNLFDRIKGDKVVWIVALLLMLMSIVCLFSSTSRLLGAHQTRLDILREQGVVVLAGIAIIAGLCCFKDTSFFKKIGWLGAVIPFILLLLLVSRIDTGFIKSIEINGARRILSVCGAQLHVFEITKVGMVVYLAWAQDSIADGAELPGPKEEKYRRWIWIYGPFLIITGLVLTGSVSAALFITIVLILEILMGEGKVTDVLLMGLCAAALLSFATLLWKVSDGKVFNRIGTATVRLFEDTDWEEKALLARTGSKEYYDAIDEIRQPYSAKIAIKQGGFIGKGPGESTQRYVVPDYSEDYMFSFIIEEYGLVGGGFVILLYVSLMSRGAIIARNCKDRFGKLVVAGMTLLISGQAFLHIFVNVDIGPMTGQTLPMISHGNFAFICFSFAFGMMLSISRMTERQVEEERKSILNEENAQN